MSSKERREQAKVLAKEHGYLQYMIERYLALWGEEETLQFIEANEKSIRSTIRVNSLKSSADTLRTRLEDKGIILEAVPNLSEGFYCDFQDMSPGSLFEHMLGYYYIQGLPSMIAARVLDPQPDETIVDLAAAPGGKTTHVAQLMENTGVIIAIDEDRLRINSLESNIARCGVTSSIVLRGDARKVTDLGIKADRIILDAPCSGEGLIPLDPSRKTSRSMADIRYCATRQDEMLGEAIKILRTGGVIVYATCSIAPEENEYIIDNALRKYPEMTITDIEFEFGSPAYNQPYGTELNGDLVKAKRFLPHLHNTEGFFICKLQKEE